MSKFKVPICRLEAISGHPNAAKLELGRVRGLQVVLKKGEFAVGELIALLPEQSIVPRWLLQRLGFWDAATNKGRLAGPDGNRVHPVTLRGELSMAVPLKGAATDASLVLTNELESKAFAEGEDVASFLGCTKYMPEPPAELLGEAYPLDMRLAARFDVEDVHNYPHILKPGEPVVVLEKIHGVFTGIADVSEEDATEHGRRIVLSKGLADQGLAFVPKSEGSNVYLRAAQLLDPATLRWRELRETLNAGELPIWVLGETFGREVQDLDYGVELDFRVFAIAVGYRYDLKYVNVDEVLRLVPSVLGLKTPKVLYRGPFDLATIEKVCRGREQVSGQELHILEGGVIIPIEERKHADLDTGRVALKCVSPEYRGRENGTEYR